VTTLVASSVFNGSKFNKHQIVEWMCILSIWPYSAHCLGNFLYNVRKNAKNLSRESATGPRFES
jgi:hypothetical protein